MSQTWIITIVVTGVVLIDLLVVSAIVYGITNGFWGPLLRDFPGSEPEPDAVRKNFQSFRSGIYSFGFSIHVAVDDEHLHLTPVRPFRWIGMKPISVPWDAVEMVKAQDKPNGWAKVKVGGTELQGPKWALGLAGPGSTES